MKPILGILILLVGACAFAGPASGEPDAREQGRILARALYQSRPAEDSTVRGTLEINPKNTGKREIPLRVHTRLRADGWESIYETTPADREAVRLTIVHHRGRGSSYLLQHRPSGGKTFGAAVRIPESKLSASFADSDFFYGDLGYPRCAFFEWPEQEIVERELKRGQSCYKLVSTNPEPGNGDYGRVVSWIDIDTGGPVEIHAYGADGERMKEFRPRGVRKVGDEYRVTQLTISNKRTRSRTTLEFDYGKDN